MRVGVQRQQTLLAATERALWRHDNAFLLTNESEADFGIAHKQWGVFLDWLRTC